MNNCIVILPGFPNCNLGCIESQLSTRGRVTSSFVLTLKVYHLNRDVAANKTSYQKTEGPIK